MGYTCLICQRKFRHPLEVLTARLCLCGEECRRIFERMSPRQRRRVTELVQERLK